MNPNSVSSNIALLGCGTIGGAVALMLTNEKGKFTRRHNCDLALKYIVDVNFAHAEKLGLDKKLFCTDYSKVLDDDSVDTVIELVGGTTTAKELMEKAIKAGKNIVTANKALIAHHGTSLLSLARDKGVTISFEASCGGGIPIIRALTDGLIANRIDALYGIVNGTSNYILTAMTRRSISYDDALKEAQKAGLAEADPTLDVSGVDSAHKLAILSSLAFGQKVDFEGLAVEGIDSLQLCDIDYGQELGYVVKLLTIAQRQEKGLILYVRPAFISKEHPLAWVSGPFNAISVYGHATGHTMYYGRGAGPKPTASAIITDLLQTAMGKTEKDFEHLNLWPDLCRPAVQLSIDDNISRFYLRIMADERPGVLAKIADRLGKHNISISSVLQKEPHGTDPSVSGVPVIITTHPAREGSLKEALKEIDNLDVVKAETVCIGIVEEYPEFLEA
ncbi:MAG: homoserine dehydrogenase [Spirochaetales bacterium]|nr:homoserine dehydrogenase [Spirochaetales bacterium]